MSGDNLSGHDAAAVQSCVEESPEASARMQSGLDLHVLECGHLVRSPPPPRPQTRTATHTASRHAQLHLLTTLILCCC